MSLASDHKALLFLGAVAALGAGVRVVRAARNDVPTSQPALERQMQAADSAAGAQRSRGRGRGGQDTSAKKRSIRRPVADSVSLPRRPQGALDRPGYVNGKLDLDVATAAQIDSLPGVSPTMAKRIVADRMRRGPFLNAAGLGRVEGAGPLFRRSIDSLVTFTGTLAASSASDTIIVRRSSPRPVPKKKP